MTGRASVLIVPLASLARFMHDICQNSSCASQVFAFAGNLKCTSTVKELERSPSRNAKVVVIARDQLFRNNRLISVLQRIGVELVIFDEADAIVNHSTFRIAFSVIRDWVSYQSSCQENVIKIPFTTATLSQRRMKQMLAKFHLIFDSSKARIFRTPAERRHSACHRFLHRDTAPNWRLEVPVSARTEHASRVKPLYRGLRAAFLACFSSCIYVNFRTDTDKLLQDFQSHASRDLTSGSNIGSNFYIDHSGLQASELVAVESFLVSDKCDRDPMVVIATLGLGLGLYF